MKKPIKSQEEAEKVFEYLVAETVRVMKVDRVTAEKRINGLLSSGILEGGNPNDPMTQMIIDAYMKGEIN